jgi:hypothetical protein
MPKSKEPGKPSNKKRLAEDSQRKRQLRIPALFGTIEYHEAYDYKAARRAKRK